MLKLSFEISRLVYKHDRHVKDLNKRLTEIYKEGVRVFVREALRHVPGYTGMSRASFVKLGTFLGEPIDLQKVAKDRNGKKPENVAEGVRRGSFAFTVARDGTLKFNFNTKVAQYRINEFIDATKYFSERDRTTRRGRVIPGRGYQYFKLRQPGPYYSMNKGKVAMMAYLKIQIPKKLPKVSNYIISTKKTFTSATFTRF